MQSMSHNNESKPLQGFFRKYRNVLYCIAGILGVALVIFLIVWLSDYLGGRNRLQYFPDSCNNHYYTYVDNKTWES